MARKGLNAEHDSIHHTVILYFGEAIVTQWSVPSGEFDDVAEYAWKRDQFVAQKLRELLQRTDVLGE